MLKKFYITLGSLCIGTYAASALFGWEMRGTRRTIPEQIRKAPGGYRAFHFWHTGYRGGK